MTNFFTVIFKRPSTPQITLTTLETDIIALVKLNNKITRKQIAKKMNIGQDTVKEYLAKLKSKGVLKRIGTKGGYWERVM